MVPNIINLQLDTYTLALVGGDGEAPMGVDGLAQELQEGLQPTLDGAGCFSIPFCYGAGESSAAGYTLSWQGTRYGGWARVIVAGHTLFLHCPQPPCTDRI